MNKTVLTENPTSTELHECERLERTLRHHHHYHWMNAAALKLETPTFCVVNNNFSGDFILKTKKT